MSEHERLTRTLELLVPPFEAEAKEWEDVLRRAERDAPVRRRRRGGRRALVVALAALGVVCALVLADPFGGGEREGVLERALAAVGDGPVLRVVSETQVGGVLIELDSGRRTEIRARREVLFDPERGIRTTVRLRGTVLEDYGAPTGKRLGYAEEAMQAFTRDYREALRSGRANVLREEEIDGAPVYWIRVPLGPKTPKARTPCRPYKFCQDVAISRETYEPLYVSISPPGYKPRILDRILRIESLPAGTGDIPGKAARQPVGFTFLPRSYHIDRSRAARMLGGRLAWQGRRLAGLRLGRIDAVGIRTFVFTKRMRRPRYGPRERVIRLALSTRGQIESGTPAKSWRPLLVVNQARRPSLALHFDLGFGPVVPAAASPAAPHGYAPPPGWVLLTSGGHRAILRHRGLFISVLASSSDNVLLAVRALTR
jgi:hypothetical protein